MPRPSAVVVPYFFDAQKTLHVFLQMRDNNPTEDKNVYSFFGGQMDPEENPEDAAIRETQEEFSYPPIITEKLGVFKNFPGGDMHVFLAPVSQAFNEETEVLEGLHGAFLTLDGIRTEPNISHIVLPVIEALETRQTEKSSLK